jgi:hypothetical protein
MAETSTCGHCGATDVGTPEAGFARGSVTAPSGDAIGATLCHPNAPGRPDCYRLVMVYRHDMPCAPCAAALSSNPLAEALAYWREKLARLDAMIAAGVTSPYPGIREATELRRPDRQHLAVLLRTPRGGRAREGGGQVSDDILTRIDGTLTDATSCFCGCRQPIPPRGPSPWYASEECQVRWNVRLITSKGGIEKVAVPAEAIAAVPVVPSGTSPGVSFADVAAGPVAGVDAAVDVRRRVQDGTAPAPDPVGDVLRAEVLRQGLTECELDGVRWVHVDGAWRVEALRSGAEPTYTVIDETHTFERHYLNEVVRGRSPALDAPATADTYGFQPGGYRACMERLAPHVDAVVGPGDDRLLADVRAAVQRIKRRNDRDIATRPWWLRWLPGGRR